MTICKGVQLVTENINIGAMRDSEEYLDFISKFAPRKGSDDCFTPPKVYDAVLNWVCKRYGVEPECVVRPFYPGGDYERFDYDGKVVVDNPPFSTFAKICRFYAKNNIKFFLFAPAMTAMNKSFVDLRITNIFTSSEIVYDNGASVRSGFVTNLDGCYAAYSAPELGQAITAAQQAAKKPGLSKHVFPEQVLRANDLQRLALRGIEFGVMFEDCIGISNLDAMRKAKKGTFGCSLLLSQRAAAERAAAERANAVVWPLSEAEMAMVRSLGEGHGAH